MALNHRFNKCRCFRERSGKHFLTAEAHVRSCHCGFQRADISYAGGATVAGDCGRVYEDKILDRYGPLLAQRSASSRMATSYSSKNSATNSITSGDGFFTVGVILTPLSWESTVTFSPGSQRNSRSISAGIGTITDPPTFFNSRSILILYSLPLRCIKQSITKSGF